MQLPIAGGKIYFIGIKGVAMSGLALICQQQGYVVAGSDVAETFLTDKSLIEAKIKIFSGFSPENLNWEPDLVIIGTSWSSEHSEVVEVRRRKIPAMNDADLRGLLSQQKRTIAVTGAHGKTTTTALMATILQTAGRQPSFLIGTGQVPALGAHAQWGSGLDFVVEGDEYSRSHNDRRPKFLDLHPAISIITTIDWEHVDVYPNVEAMENVFGQLVEQTSEAVIACGDSVSVAKVLAQHTKAKAEIITYGFGSTNVWQPSEVQRSVDRTAFRLSCNSIDHGIFEIKLFGDHNVLNATATIIAALRLGLTVEEIRFGLLAFTGTQRRFDVIEKNGIVYVDDYAHHPSEIQATLKAIAQRWPDRPRWCVFQSHTISRTKALLSDFAQSFSMVDKVIVADIFASAREAGGGLTTADLVAAIQQYHKDVIAPGDFGSIVSYIAEHRPNDAVIITMGAGDIYKIRDTLLL